MNTNTELRPTAQSQCQLQSQPITIFTIQQYSISLNCRINNIQQTEQVAGGGKIPSRSTGREVRKLYDDGQR